MRLKGPYLFALLLLIIFSCNEQDHPKKDGTTLNSSQIQSLPKKVKLNLEEGYVVNQFTGDSIQTFINSSGDTLVTGVPIPVKGRIIHPDSVLKPKTVVAGKPMVEPAHLNISQIPENLPVVPIDIKALKSSSARISDPSFVLVNYNGDTIPTGVPIPIKGNIVKAIHRHPIIASQPRIKGEMQENIKYLDVDEGLTVPFVHSILEDKTGNLWIGTYGGGVGRYDGDTFTPFTQKEGLSNDFIQSLFEDKSGNLWIGTNEGVTIYDGETFTRITEKEGLINNSVRAIIEDKNGNIWLGTAGGVDLFDGEYITHITSKEGLTNTDVYSIIEDKNGIIWIGTWGDGVYIFDGKSFTNLSINEGLCNNQVRTCYEDSEGNIWIATKNGVQIYDGESLTHLSENEGLIDNDVLSIFEDGNGNIWIGTVNEGLSVYSGKSFWHLTEEQGLSDNFIHSIYEDKSGNIWIGTDGGGLNIYNGRSFTHLKKKEGSSNNQIRDIIEDKHGNIWLGIWSEGISKYDGVSISYFTQEDGLPNDDVVSIMEDKKGNIWIGTYGGGVGRYDGENFTYFTEKEGLTNNNVHTIFEDKIGNIWFGTSAGATMYNGKVFTHFTEKEGLIDNDVRSFLQDKNDDIWMGTFEGGLSKYNGKTFTHYTKNEGLSDNYIWDGIEDKNGNLWFGTWNGGVNMFDGKSFTHFAEKQGLSSNNVKSILEDTSGNIWFGTEHKITMLDFSNLNDSLQIPLNTNIKNTSSNFFKVYTYDKQDGLNGINMFAHSVYLDSKNQIWWGSRKGTVILNMNTFKSAYKSPKIQFKSITINKEFIDFHNLNQNDSLGYNYTKPVPFYNYPENLVLDYNRNHLTFHFSAIDWAAPHKIKYSYKIDELNDQWSEPTKETKAEYRNLHYGNYTFKVKAIGAGQKWSNTFEYVFNIAPPWWHTWWARVGYVITGIFLLVGFVKFRTRSIERQKKTLESTVVERTATVVAQKEEIESTLKELQQTQTQLVQSEKMASLGVLTAGIAHEINNPINFISAGTNNLDRDFKDLIAIINGLKDIPEGGEQLIEKAKVLNELKEKHYFDDILQAIPQTIEDINVGVKRTNEIVRGLMLYSRSEGEQLQRAGIHESIDSALLLLNDKHKHKIEIIKNYKSRIKKINCFPGQLNQVFVNLLDNAMASIDNKGTISIGTRSKNGQLIISIRDTGKGIPEDIIAKIFDPFFTTKSVGKGTGLGLSICQGIIKKHKGKLTVRSTVGKGSEFVVEIPKTK